ncbi:MAG TPA: glycoside hydrolase family 15 protein [Chitinophagaceae bacterium]
MDEMKTAPGAPGMKPIWTSSAKSGIGKAINAGSNIVFTIGHGIINEVYFPREDTACIKDMEFIITDGKDFFSEEKRDTQNSIRMMKEGIPAYHITNTCIQRKYAIEKEVIADPFRNALLQKVNFKSAKTSSPLNLYVLLCPHINNRGSDNYGWIGEYKGIPMLFASADGVTLALACSANFLKRSVGYVGKSDGWTDLHQHKEMQWQYEKTNAGNIALTAQIDISGEKDFILAVGFGRTGTEAGNRAWASILDGFELAKERYIDEWNKWHSLIWNGAAVGNNLKISAAVLRMGEAKSFPGGIVASISIPWGTARGDDDIGGYHLVWGRDLAESAGGFLALKAKEDVLRAVNYLMSTQEEDGKWWQNLWLEGDPYWKGIQMDQIALPILLIDACDEIKLIEDQRMKRYWPGIKKAISFLIVRGPATQQDRWEQKSGLSVYTLATEVAALLAAAHLAELNDERDIAKYCWETADYLNSKIEEWTYVTNTSLAKKYNVDGYYIRINPFYQPVDEVSDRHLKIDHLTVEEDKLNLAEVISVDALALVRFGLRAADDPKILNTVKLIDATLKVDTPYGEGWHRFTKDAYGEDENGNPFVDNNGKGKGRVWPLLTGERAHYELAAGNMEKAKALLKTMEAFSRNGFLPEQVWDTQDIPEKELYFGQPTGSAMPLTWAHAEYVKLYCSIQANKVVDMPLHTQKRYVHKKNISRFEVWRFNSQCKEISLNKILRIEVMSTAIVHWSDDDWLTINETETKDTGLGIHLADVKLKNKNGNEIKFTFFWKEDKRWENKDFSVVVKQE